MQPAACVSLDCCPTLNLQIGWSSDELVAMGKIQEITRLERSFAVHRGWKICCFSADFGFAIALLRFKTFLCAFFKGENMHSCWCVERKTLFTQARCVELVVASRSPSTIKGRR